MSRRLLPLPPNASWRLYCSLIDSAMMILIFSYWISVWMAIFLARHVTSARSTGPSMARDTQFEKSCPRRLRLAIKKGCEKLNSQRADIYHHRPTFNEIKWVTRFLLVLSYVKNITTCKIHLLLQKDAEKYIKINLITSLIQRILHKEAWEGRTLSTHWRVEMCIEIRISR